MASLKAFGIKEGQGKYYEEAAYRLALIYNIMINEITSYLQDFDLTPGKFNILMVIQHQGQDQGLAQVEVSKHLIVTPSNMTKLINKLENEGLVTRSALKADRRVNMMRITPKGSKLLDRVWGGYNEKLKMLTHGLNIPKQKNLAALLKDWLNCLQKK